MSVERTKLQTEIIDGNIYAIGGHNGSTYNSSVEVYDIDTDTWTTLSSMSVERAYFQTKTINGKIYAIGGNNSNGYLSSTEVYDPDTDTWTTLSSMSTARNKFQTEVIDGTIYAIGGYDGSNNLSSVESYTVASTPDAPTNLTATAGDSQVSLSWNSVSDATSYTVMRATTSGGDYTAIATGVTLDDLYGYGRDQRYYILLCRSGGYR